MKSEPKVKITGTASSKPQVSNSMIKSQPKTTTKPKAPAVSKTTKTPTPTTTKAPAKPKMTAQDAAMLKILQKKYGANVYKG
jgi:hypothetical protein